MNKLLYPSMMCANFENLANEVHALSDAGIDAFHMDIMDGSFVPNFGMGMQDYEYIVGATDVPVDAHLMIMNPGNYIDFFADKGAKIIYFHPEAELQPARTVDKIHARGMQAGIAIDPGTSVESVRSLLTIADRALVMTVNPGFAGQKYLSFVDEKIDELASLQKELCFDIVVDGAISEERVLTLSKHGVRGFVLGTSALFGKKESYANIIARLKGKVLA
ncbi:ribulose-phosphate 3-epimerase [Lacticaseibacillus songhuajiangensis]|jgi:ribulose-phosphate 3-epimerase|uniref:ribulose-phosphate 3-epimerase n=1 Tax=Lacticaseibacillus songhuajiangensis TaxID=1296539 RepID=UPI001CDD79EC|nr:ribulose-phosphate 3-epimerase [Lacticaseibacillus songhuajiangensis]